MLEFKYRDREDEWKFSAWPWATVHSIESTLADGSVKDTGKGSTLSDSLETRARLSSIITAKGIGHKSKINARAASSAIAEKRVKSIKDLFTGPCPICKTVGEAIPREILKFKNSMPGLYCPKCDEWFPPRSVYQERPVFAVAAGPSLDKNINELSRVKGRYPIFAVDTALPTMIKHGIKPDFCVTVEVDPLINRMKIDTEDVGLIATVVVDSDFRNSWKGPIYLMDGYPGGKREAAKRKRDHGDIGWAAAGGNVSSVMLSMLTGVFPSHVIFVGHDFSYPHIQNYYPSGGPMSMIPVKEIFRTHDLYGNTVYTDGSLYNYREWSQLMIASQLRYGITRFVNATEGGIFGASYYDPKKFIRIRRKARVLKYQFDKWRIDGKWPKREEAEENGFAGPRLDIMEYITLAEAIGKYCPDAHKE